MAAGVADGKGVVLRQNIDNRGPDPGRAALRQKGRLQAAGAGLGGEAPPGQVLGQGGAGFPLLEVQLRVFVEIPAQFPQGGLIVLDQLVQPARREI